jgi:enoyl-CoA hydratase/carnithine racemase
MTSVKAVAKPAQIRVARRSPAYWRVTIDNPPINVMGPEMVHQFQEVIGALEADEHVRVVVFDSAVDDYFLNHSDFLAKLEDLTAMPDGPTDLPPWPDLLVRLTRLPVASIAVIRGRATGNGSEITLACDMSFASREKAIISQWEVGVGMVAGGGPMARLPQLIGRKRALEVLLSSEDIRGEQAEAYGYVNRALPDADLDAYVEALATRIAAFDKWAIANGHPYTYLDLDADATSRNFLDHFSIVVSEIPIVICNGTMVLRNPLTSQLADCLGLNDNINKGAT